MKRLRLAYEGTCHHCINRGINGEDIFSGQKKAHFLEYLEEAITIIPQ